MGSERHGQTTSTLDEGPLRERSVSETGESRQARPPLQSMGQCFDKKARPLRRAFFIPVFRQALAATKSLE